MTFDGNPKLLGKYKAEALWRIGSDDEIIISLCKASIDTIMYVWST